MAIPVSPINGEKVLNAAMTVGGGVKDLIDGGYGRKAGEAYERGEYGTALTNVAAGTAYAVMNVLTFGEAGAINGLGKAAMGCCCFPAGTPVATEQGMVPIEKIQVGQLVFARDPETGDTKLKPVTQLITTPAKPLFELVTVDASGKRDRMEVTDNHPYWVKGKGWVDAENLIPGMVLQNLDDSDLNVISLEKIGRDDVTYNFTVADYHTYFAGRQKAFVHNCTCALGAAALAKEISPTYRELLALDLGKLGFQAHHILPQYLGKMLGYTEKQMLDQPATLISQWAHTGKLNPEAMHKAIATYLPPRVGNVNVNYSADQIRVGLERAYNAISRPDLFNAISPLIK